MKRELAGSCMAEAAATDLVNSSCSWPGSGGKNLTASLNRVFAGPGKQQHKNPKTNVSRPSDQGTHPTEVLAAS